MNLSELKEAGLISPAGFSFYAALGISTDCRSKAVKQAFGYGVSQLNLDDLETLEDSDAEKSLVLAKVTVLQKAFERLGSSTRRAEYDAMLRNAGHAEPSTTDPGEGSSYLSWSYWTSPATSPESHADASNGVSNGCEPHPPAELDWLPWSKVLRSNEAENGSIEGANGVNLNDQQSENTIENGAQTNKNSTGKRAAKAAQQAVVNALTGEYGHTGRASVLAVAGCFIMEKTLGVAYEAKDYMQSSIESTLNPENLHDIQVFEHCDTFPGEDAEVLVKSSFEPEWWFIKRAKQTCVENGYGGFVLYHNPALALRAYLRPQSPEDLLKNKNGPSYYYAMSTLYVIPATTESTIIERQVANVATAIDSSKEAITSYVDHENLHDMEYFDRCDAFPGENAEMMSQFSLEPEAVFIQRAKWRCKQAGFGGFVLLRHPYRHRAYLRNRTRSELLRHRTEPSYRYIGCTLYVLRAIDNQQLALGNA